MPNWIFNLGDCLDPMSGILSLIDQSVDVVITDPPYSESVHTRRPLTNGLNGYPVPEIDFVPLTDEAMVVLAREFARLCRRWVFIFCADVQIGKWWTSLESSGLEIVRAGAWVKADPMPQVSGDRPSQGLEFMLLAHRPGAKHWNGGGKPLVYRGPRLDGKPEHPTQKPLYLMKRIVHDFTDRGEVVLDPFAGSATTGVAAVSQGRHFIGWEKDRVYYEKARHRLEEKREQLEFAV